VSDLDRAGRDVLVVVAKLRYAVDVQGRPRVEPAAIRFQEKRDEGAGCATPAISPTTSRAPTSRWLAPPIRAPVCRAPSRGST